MDDGAMSAINFDNPKIPMAAVFNRYKLQKHKQFLQNRMRFFLQSKVNIIYIDSINDTIFRAC